MIKLLLSNFSTKRLLLGYRRNKSLILEDNIHVFIINPPTNDYSQFISSKMKCLIAALFGNKNWKACQIASTLTLPYKHSNAMLLILLLQKMPEDFKFLIIFLYCKSIIKFLSSIHRIIRHNVMFFLKCTRIRMFIIKWKVIKNQFDYEFLY